MSVYIAPEEMAFIITEQRKTITRLQGDLMDLGKQVAELEAEVLDKEAEERKWMKGLCEDAGVEYEDD